MKNILLLFYATVALLLACTQVSADERFLEHGDGTGTYTIDIPTLNNLKIIQFELPITDPQPREYTWTQFKRKAAKATSNIAHVYVGIASWNNEPVVRIDYVSVINNKSIYYLASTGFPNSIPIMSDNRRSFVGEYVATQEYRVVKEDGGYALKFHMKYIPFTQISKSTTTPCS